MRLHLVHIFVKVLVLIKELEEWLYQITSVKKLQPFEEAKVRLNVRVTWVFLVIGMIYAISFIPGKHYLVAGFAAFISLSFIFIPVTFRRSFDRFRQPLYFLIVVVFITFNMLGCGNITSIPIVLWMVLVVQLTNAVLTPASSFSIALAIILTYIVKEMSIGNGMVFPNWLPAEMMESPRIIDYAAPLSCILCLSFNSYKFGNWAQAQLLVSQEKMKQLNRDIADAEWRNKLIVEKSLGFMGIHDESGKILFINDATSLALGFTQSTLVGTNISKMLHSSVTDGFAAYVERICKDGSAQGIMRIQSALGETLFWYYRNIAIRDDHGQLNILCFAHDVTELERTRQQLQKARSKAEESDRMKSLFLANISHEFRTPMNAIIGFSELLENPGITPTRRALFGKHIRERSLSLLGMLNNLIDFARLEVGHVPLHPIDGSIDELMEKVVVAIEAETIYINQKDVKIMRANHLVPALSRVRLDYFKLNQVLGNLVSNAIKFTNSGYVLLECEESEPGVLLFTVSDTGEGIQPEILETIFRPFRQANDNIKRKYGGSGLGLAICKGLVESWDGKIWVESTPGRGSKFSFTVPWMPVLA